MIQAYRRCFRAIRDFGSDGGVGFPCAWLSLVLLFNILTVVNAIEVAFGIKLASSLAPYSLVAYVALFVLHWLWLGRSEQHLRDQEEAIQEGRETDSTGCWIYALGSPFLFFVSLGLRIAL